MAATGGAFRVRTAKRKRRLGYVADGTICRRRYGRASLARQRPPAISAGNIGTRAAAAKGKARPKTQRAYVIAFPSPLAGEGGAHAQHGRVRGGGAARRSLFFMTPHPDPLPQGEREIEKEGRWVCAAIPICRPVSLRARATSWKRRRRTRILPRRTPRKPSYSCS